MNEQTTVTIDRQTAAKLDKLAKANKVTKKEFFAAALDYFERNGINPLEHESPAKEMQKLIKRVDQVVSFIKVQERDILRPMLEAVSASEARINKDLDNIATKDQVKTLQQQTKDTAEKHTRELYQFSQGITQRLERNSTQEQQAFKHLGNLIDAKQKTGFLSDIASTYNQTKNG